MRAALFLSAGALGWLGVGGFLAPPTRSSNSPTKARLPRPCTALAEYPNGPLGSTTRKDEDGDKNYVQDHLRDAIWKATDAVIRAVDDMPKVKHEETLQRIGKYIEEVDQKYFGKYRSVGVTSSYLGSLSPKVVKEGKEEETAAATGALRMNPEEAKEPAPSPVPDEALVVAPASEMTEQVSAQTASNSSSSSSSPLKPDSERVASADDGKAGSGTVQLDRPKQVQGVFDELQKKAVEYYKQGPGIVGFGQKNSTDPKAEAVAAAAAEAAARAELTKETEAKLEDLMKECKFKPRALGKDKRGELVQALNTLEESYPKDAAPLADPALRGEWTLVYCSSRNFVGRILRGLLSKLVAVSSPTQTIDKIASSVTNTCRVRLRLTRLQWGRLSQKGTFRVSAVGGEAALRKVEVTFPEVTRPRWRRVLLPRLNTEAAGGKIQTEVIYLSDHWRICRANGVTFAFRKSS